MSDRGGNQGKLFPDGGNIELNYTVTDQTPEGWVCTTIGEVSELNPSKPPADAFPATTKVTFVPMAAVDHETGTIAEPQQRTYSSTRKGYTYFAENDVIMAKITPSMENGKAAVATNLQNEIGFGSTELHVFRSKGSVLPKYLFYFVRQESFRAAAQAQMTGTAGQLRVPAEFLSEAEIPLPPLAEQQRIVNQIEKLTGQVKTTRERLERTKLIIERFRQAVLDAACSGRLTEAWRAEHPDVKSVEGLLESTQELIDEIKARRQIDWPKYNKSKKYKAPREVDCNESIPDAWECISSDLIFSFVTSGSRGWARYYADRGASFIRVGNFNRTSINLDRSDIKNVNPPDSAERDRTRVHPGDLLITITADVGMVAVAPEDIGEAYVNQHVAIARPVNDVYTPYVAWFLAAPKGGQTQFKDTQYGVTKAGLKLDDVKSLAIPFPPLEEQHEIVNKIESLLKFAETFSEHVEVSLKRTEKMRQSILAKAFRGELVPTEADLAAQESRDYEHAVELLKRIQTEQVVLAEERKQRRKRVAKKGSTAKTAEVQKTMRKLLSDSRNGMTPEELFSEAGFTPERVEDFYQELRGFVESGQIIERRPNDSDVYLEAAST